MTDAVDTDFTLTPPPPGADAAAEGHDESDIEFALRTLRVTQRPQEYLREDGSLDRAKLERVVRERGQILGQRLMHQDAPVPSRGYGDKHGEGRGVGPRVVPAVDFNDREL